PISGSVSSRRLEIAPASLDNASLSLFATLPLRQTAGWHFCGPPPFPLNVNLFATGHLTSQPHFRVCYTEDTTLSFMKEDGGVHASMACHICGRSARARR